MVQSPVQIVPATLLHLPALRYAFASLAIERGAAAPAPAYPVVTDTGLDAFVGLLLKWLREGNPFFTVLVALDDQEQLVGFVGLEIVGRPVAEPHTVGQAHWLYVDPVARGGTVGRQLALAAAKWCLGHGVDMMECSATVGDPQWERRGWVAHEVKYHAPVSVVVERALVGLVPDAPEIVAAPVVEDRPHPVIPAAVNGRRRRRRKPREASLDA